MPMRLPAQLADPALAACGLALCACAGTATAVLYRRLRRGLLPDTIVGMALLLIAIGQGMAWAGDYPAIFAGMALSGASAGLLLMAQNRIFVVLALFLAPSAAAAAESFAGDVRLGTSIAAAVAGCWLLGFAAER